MILNNVREALEYALSIIRKHEKVIDFQYFNREKGLAGAIVLANKNNYLISFQKNLFGSFKYEDEEGNLKNGVGVALNKEDLFLCKNKNYIPMKVMSDGKMYVFNASKWINWCEDRKNSRYAIRKKDDRDVPTDSWVYYNIPFKLMINYLKFIEEMTELKTLEEIKEEYLEAEQKQKGILPHVKEMTDGALIFGSRIRQEAIKIMKLQGADLNIADWVEFFNLEEEYADLCFGKTEEIK